MSGEYRIRRGKNEEETFQAVKSININKEMPATEKDILAYLEEEKEHAPSDKTIENHLEKLVKNDRLKKTKEAGNVNYYQLPEYDLVPEPKSLKRNITEIIHYLRPKLLRWPFIDEVADAMNWDTESRNFRAGFKKAIDEIEAYSHSINENYQDKDLDPLEYDHDTLLQYIVSSIKYRLINYGKKEGEQRILDKTTVETGKYYLKHGNKDFIENIVLKIDKYLLDSDEDFQKTVEELAEQGQIIKEEQIYEIQLPAKIKRVLSKGKIIEESIKYRPTDKNGK